MSDKRVLPRRGRTAPGHQLGKIAFEVGAKSLAELARIGAQEQAQQANRPGVPIHDYASVRNQPFLADQRGEARQPFRFLRAARAGRPATA